MTKNYIILGNIAQGVNKDFIGCLQQIQKKLSAQVIHVGPLTTTTERQVYRRSVDVANIWENILRQQTEMTEHEANVWDKKIESLAGKIEKIEDAQSNRVEFLTKTFVSMEFVARPDQLVEFTNCSILVQKQRKLGKWLIIDPMEPSGENVNQQPITTRARNYFARFNTSVICCHGIPVCETRNAPGVNQVHEFWTTGQLATEEDTLRGSYRPTRALLVTVPDSGEFFVTPLWFESSIKAVLFDGMIFTPTGYSWLPQHAVTTIIADAHAENVCEPVLRVADSLSGNVLFLGDSVSCTAINPHVNPLHKERLGRTLGDDIETLAALSKRFQDRMQTWVVGNHEAWFYSYMATHPELKGCALDLFCGVKGRIIRREQGVVHQIGDFTTRHGDQENLTTGSLLFGKYVCGHWHTHREWLRALQLGTAGDVKQGYIQDQISGWTNNVGVATTHMGVTSICAKFISHGKGVIKYAWQGQVITLQEEEWSDSTEKPIRSGGTKGNVRKAATSP